MKKELNKLSFWQTALYSLSSSGLNILSITVSTWILYFYAPPADSGRISYLPVTMVGLLLTLVGLWDAFIDPAIGHWSDNLKSRWGRRKPFMVIGAPIVAVAVVLIWMPPANGSQLQNVLYFIFVTLMYFTAQSLVGIPYDATLAEMAPDSKQRLNLSFWKNIFGILGVLIGSLVAAPLFDTIGPVAMGLVVGVVAIITIWVSAFFGVKENKRTIDEPMPIMVGIKTTLQNTQFLIIFFSTLLVHITYQVLLANLPYFVTLVMKSDESSVAIFQGVLILTMAATGPLWVAWNKRKSQKELLTIALIALGIVLLIGYFIGFIPGVPLMVQGLVFMALCGASLGGYLIIIYAIMGNVVDYDEIRFKQRREAIYYGSFSLALGIGIAVGSLVLPQILNGFGYTLENPMGVRVAYPFMALFVFAGVAVLRKYKLGDSPEETIKNLNLKKEA